MQVTPLWQSEKHNAFTDLSIFNGQWFCVFREGSTHMSLDGQILVLCSSDAVTWQEHSRLNWQGGDLRDPKLNISPNKQLILTAGIRWAVYSTAKSRLYSVAWTLDNNTWSQPILDASSEGKWRWAVTWHQGWAYSVGYGANDLTGCLYCSQDGLHWQRWVEDFFPNPEIFTNESSLVSDGDRLWCLSRRDGKVGDKSGGKAVLGVSTGRLQHWRWQVLSKHIGGPKLMKLSNGEIVVAGRYINFKRWTAKTNLYKLNKNTGRLKLLRTLPSTGDCSYPGMVEKDKKLYVSYYSTSHFGIEENAPQANVFLAVIPLIKSKRSKKFK